MSVVCTDVRVTYGAREVIHEVDLAVALGGWVTLIGANGAGKSSLLRAIAGLVAFRGQVAINGAPSTARSRRALAREIAFVPQRPMLPPTMTVADYVHLGRTPYLSLLGGTTRADAEIVGETLDRLDLHAFAPRRLSEISGGEAQRAVLARALAQQSPVLVLDEPTTALDLGHQQRVLQLIDELRHERGLTVVSSSHDLALAGQFADELVLLARGAVVATGTAPAVLTPENLAAHYGAHVEVHALDGGGIAVVPLRREPSAS